MHFAVTCPGCRALVCVDSVALNERAHCRRCRHSFQLPADFAPPSLVTDVGEPKSGKSPRTSAGSNLLRGLLLAAFFIGTAFIALVGTGVGAWYAYRSSKEPDVVAIVPEPVKDAWLDFEDAKEPPKIDRPIDRKKPPEGVREQIPLNYDARKKGLIAHWEKTHAWGTNSISFNPDGARVLTGGVSKLGRSGEVKLWEFPSGREIKKWSESGPARLTADGSRMLTMKGDSQLVIRDFPSDKIIHADVLVKKPFNVSRDGKKLIFPEKVNAIMQKLVQIEIATGKRADFDAFAYGSYSFVTYSHDTSLVAGRFHERDPFGREFSRITFVELATGTEKASIPDMQGSVVFSPDGKLAGMGYTLFDTTFGFRIAKLPLRSDSDRHIAASVFSPDGKWFACGDQDGAIHVWDVASKKLYAHVHAGLYIHELAFSPNHRYLVAALRDHHWDHGSVKVWDLNEFEAE